MPNDEAVVVRSVASLREAEAYLARLWIIAVRNQIDPPRIYTVDVAREVTLTMLFRDFRRWLECAGDHLG